MAHGAFVEAEFGDGEGLARNTPGFAQQAADRPGGPAEAGDGDVRQEGPRVRLQPDTGERLIDLVVKLPGWLLRRDADPQAVDPSLALELAHPIEREGEAGVMDRAKRGRDVFRPMAIDLADETQRQVELVVALPAGMRHAAHQAEQAFAHGARRADGDEETMHERVINLRPRPARNRFRLKWHRWTRYYRQTRRLWSGTRSFLTMANWSDPQTTAVPRPAGVGTAEAAYDAGLRSYMLSVYNYMASGVLLTGLVAMLFARSGYAEQIMAGPGLLKYLIVLSPLAIVFGLSFGVNRLSTGAAQGLFWAFATLMGLSLSTIFLVYTGVSIAQTFFATAVAFGGLSLYGYTTKRDLGPVGTFLIMGLIGLLVVSLINLFIQSETMSYVIGFVGVLIFAGLTAYDTQKIKSLYFHVAGTDFVGKSVVMGALTLYLDFINMFLFLLRFMGDRR